MSDNKYKIHQMWATALVIATITIVVAVVGGLKGLEELGAAAGGLFFLYLMFG